MDKTTGKICLMISAKEVDFSQHLILLDEYPSWDYHTLDESRLELVVCFDTKYQFIFYNTMNFQSGSLMLSYTRFVATCRCVCMQS